MSHADADGRWYAWYCPQCKRFIVEVDAPLDSVLRAKCRNCGAWCTLEVRTPEPRQSATVKLDGL